MRRRLGQSHLARFRWAKDSKAPAVARGDFVVGTEPSSVATLVERASRYTTIVALPDGISKLCTCTAHLGAVSWISGPVWGVGVRITGWAVI